MKNRVLSVFILIILSKVIIAQNNDSIIQPQFKSGTPWQFLAINMKYPEVARDSCIMGIVLIKFVVDTAGNLDSIQLYHSVHPLLDKEALRVVSLMSGQWKPGSINGKLVRVTFTLPINFLIQDAGCPDSDFYYNQGVDQYNRGNIDKAIQNFATAFRLNPNLVEALLNIAIIKINQHDIQSACQYLNEVKGMGKPGAEELLEKYCK